MKTKLSECLKPIFDLEMRLGNEILRTDEDAWTETPLAIVLKRPLHFAEIRRELTLSPDVTEWKNEDPHYSLERGFHCKRTRHSISGPISGEFTESQM